MYMHTHGIVSFVFLLFVLIFLCNGSSNLDHAMKSGALQVGHWGCFNQVDKVGHSRNSWTQLDYPSIKRRRDGYLAGETFWINEHMAIGHAQYDIVIMEVLRHANVSRIVLQRSPCLTPLLCHGIGTWKAWYSGFYASMIDAFRPGIPIYIRWGRTAELSAHYMSVNQSSGDVYEEVRENDTISLKTNQCFETVWRRTECPMCVQSAVSLSTARLFQQSAMKLIVNRGDIFQNAFMNRFGLESTTAIRVLHAYRGASSSRHINNIDKLQLYLSNAFKSSSSTATTTDNATATNTTTPSIIFLSLPTPESNYQEQIQMVHSADVLITEHGAFQSNMVFMRCGAAVVDLRGSYWGREKGSDKPIIYAEAVARAFGLKFSHVVMSKLSQHGMKSFSVTKDDMNAIVRQVRAVIVAMTTSNSGQYNQSDLNKWHSC